MNDKRHFSQGSVATARKPRLVVAGSIGVLGRATSQLQMHGWEVVNVPATDAVRTALTRKPTAMLLPEETGAETGYLVAAKVLEARRKTKVVVIGAKRTREAERFAHFIGAGFLAESDGVSNLIAALGC